MASTWTLPLTDHTHASQERSGTPKPHVLITRQLLPEVLDLISGTAELEVWPDEHPPGPDRLKELLSDKEGVLTNIIDKIDADVMDAAPGLKVISQLGVGADNIDVSEV